MSPRRRSVAALLAGAALAASLAVGAGGNPVHGVGLLPLPSPPMPHTSVPLASIPLPLPSVPVPTPSPPLPSVPLPLPSLPVPTPSLPLPTLGQPTPDLGTPTPSPGGVTPDSSATEDDASTLTTSGRDDTEPPGPPGSEVTGGVSGGTRTAPFARPRILEAPPVPPSLADVGSWLVPGLAVAVPALLLAALVAFEILSGAIGVRAARGGLDRVGSFVPHWLGRDDRERRSRGQPT
jgi:hypothetical protein